jgi:WD40 repeat protein
MGSGISSKKGFNLLRSLTSNRSDQDDQGSMTQVHPVWSMVVAQNGKQLAAACADHQIHLWCLVTWQILISLRGHGDTVWQVAYSPDNRLLASASADGTIRIWEVDSGFPMGVLPRTDANWIWCLSFSPDSMTLVSGGADTRMTLCVQSKLWCTSSRRFLLSRWDEDQWQVCISEFHATGSPVCHILLGGLVAR